MLSPRLLHESSPELQSLGLQVAYRPTLGPSTAPSSGGAHRVEPGVVRTPAIPVDAPVSTARGEALAAAHYAQFPQSTAATSYERSQRVRLAHGRDSDSASGSASAGVVVPSFPAPPAVGAPGIASAGVGVGGAALALLALAAICLLPALLRGHVALDLFRWQSTLLTSRLERPG
jgi:hypothetical protein